MSDEDEAHGAEGNDSEGGGRRRRRRRRRRRGGGNGAEGGNFDDLLVASGSGPDEPPPPEEGDGRRRGRRQTVEVVGPAPVSVPASGRNPYRKRSTRDRRSMPGSAGARRRRLGKADFDRLALWLGRMGDAALAVLYKGLGGQPNRVPNRDRMVQLIVKALAQGSRLRSVLKNMHEKDRKALAALLQCGGVAHHKEFHRELQLSLGGHEREWQRTMVMLGNRGLVGSSPDQDGDWFYLVPEPLIDSLVAELTEEMAVPTFSHPDVRVVESRPFCPPLHFSITSLCSYIDRVSPRLTQRHDIYRADKEAMDAFFSQIWEPDSDLFAFHLDFLMMHGMVELRGEYLALNRDVTEEWLQLDSEDQRDLLFRALDKRFSMAEWVLWAIHEATRESTKGADASESGGDWVAERPLVSNYRRWMRGEDWRERYQRGSYANARSHERESYSFAPLVRAGLLEMGNWGQEKFYRLSPRGRQLLEPSSDDGFQAFYLTPSFEIMAPAGLAPILLFRIGELAELTGCDRANTYRITELSIEKAMERGWRRDDTLQFLRDNSQIGLPENVENTLKGWIGHRGDVEFHDLMVLTVHRSQIKRFESNRKVKPYVLHRFAAGLYAVDRTRLPEIRAVLEDSSFNPAKDVRNYPGAPEHMEARHQLHRQVAEARQALEPVQRGAAVVQPEDMQVMHGAKQTRGPGGKSNEPELPPEVTFDEVRLLIDVAMSEDKDLEMVYVAKTGQRLPLRVQPQRLAFKAESPVLVGLDRADDERRTFMLDKIERMRLFEEEG